MKFLRKKVFPVIAMILALLMIFNLAACSSCSKKYTVKYMLDEETVYQTQTYKEGDGLRAPSYGYPDKEGYTFQYWSYEMNGKEDWHEGDAVTTNLTFYAVFKSLSGSNNPNNPNEPENPEDPPKEPDDETTTVLTSDTAISLVAGQTWQLTASDGVTWASSNTSVATVNSTGVVTAKTKGVAKVTATTQSEVITCTVIVLAASEAASSGTAKDPFSFSKSVDIGSVTGTGSGPAVSNPDADEYIVHFIDANGAISQNVAKGGLVVEPLVEKDGYYLKGWKNGSADYDFTQPVTANLNLTAIWGINPTGFELIKGNEESIALEWSGSKTAVQYKLSGESNWTTVDSELVRESGGSVRADILGLKAGTYDVQAGGQTINGIPVKAYDRSGYAHFNYNNKGVGAYNNDGTLKDNALVIYVTEANKDTVMDQVAAANNDVTMFSIPNYTGKDAAPDAKNWNGKNASGIGWWLNNNQYTSNNAASSKNKHPSNTYDPTNGTNLGFKMVNRPIVIRFIGTVTTPEGCTSYNHTDEGGGVGDNGHMVRMKDLKDVTIEGVGDDAVIEGWGFHFVSGGGAKDAGRGTSFEVRNLTFTEYPEDAIGMEGQATSKAITAPVERCWIHHNTFLPGHCANPAESDKKEGDGSCDFKRGYYFTASYNYFEYCHKTNLIGSSDDSLQYNMTYHHNIWYQCGSRIPLTRQANVHFYNNYVFGDPAQKTTPYAHISKPALSYVHSLRASCYLFSEYNYYEGCKNLLRGASEGGDGKFYGNTYYACADTKAPVTEVTSRTQAVSNSCKDPTTNTSYATFDTSSTLFYYDATNQKTNCLLDDSLSARLRAIFYAGAQGHGEITKKMQQMNNTAPVSTPSITKATKAKGQAYVFSVAAKAVLTIDATGESPQVLRNDGKIYLDTFSGQRTVMLDAGTYMVCSGKKDKEITINSLSVKVDDEEAKKGRIADAERLIGNIPDTITRSSGAVIYQAEAAYASLLSDEERAALAEGIAERLAKAQTAYEEILVAYAVARIDYIGDVTLDSKNDIEQAAKAYAEVPASAKSKVENYDKLATANATFAGFAIASVKFEIERLPLSSDIELILDSRPAVELAWELYNNAYQAYGELDKEEKDGINVTNVEAALALLNKALEDFELADQQAQALVDFLALIETIDVSNIDIAKAGQLKSLYDTLSADQKNGLTAEQKAKYDAIIAVYNDYMNRAVTIGFTSGKDNYYDNMGDYVSVTGSLTSVSEKFDGVDYTSALKMESGTRLKILASNSNRKIVLHFASATASGSIKDANDSSKIFTMEGSTITIELAAGESLSLTKKDGTKNYLFLMEILPA